MKWKVFRICIVIVMTAFWTGLTASMAEMKLVPVFCVPVAFVVSLIGSIIAVGMKPTDEKDKQ